MERVNGWGAPTVVAASAVSCCESSAGWAVGDALVGLTCSVVFATIRVECGRKERDEEGSIRRVSHDTRVGRECVMCKQCHEIQSTTEQNNYRSRMLGPTLRSYMMRRRGYHSFLFMRLYPNASGGLVTQSGGLCFRIPSLAYLNCPVDGWSHQSRPRTLGRATIP
jgi:hypothetical protein